MDRVKDWYNPISRFCRLNKLNEFTRFRHILRQINFTRSLIPLYKDRQSEREIIIVGWTEIFLRYQIPLTSIEVSFEMGIPSNFRCKYIRQVNLIKKIFEKTIYLRTTNNKILRFSSQNRKMISNKKSILPLFSKMNITII